MMSLLGTSFLSSPHLRPFFPKSWDQGIQWSPLRPTAPIQKYLPAQESNRAALAALGLPGRVINAPLASAYSDLLPPEVQSMPPGVRLPGGPTMLPPGGTGYRGPPARFGTGRPTLPPIGAGRRQESGYYERRNPVFAKKQAMLRALRRG